MGGVWRGEAGVVITLPSHSVCQSPPGLHSVTTLTGLQREDNPSNLYLKHRKGMELFIPEESDRDVEMSSLAPWFLTAA